MKTLCQDVVISCFPLSLLWITISHFRVNKQILSKSWTLYYILLYPITKIISYSYFRITLICWECQVNSEHAYSFIFQTPRPVPIGSHSRPFVIGWLHIETTGMKTLLMITYRNQRNEITITALQYKHSCVFITMTNSMDIQTLTDRDPAWRTVVLIQHTKH